jgi:hypothetical protein
MRREGEEKEMRRREGEGRGKSKDEIFFPNFHSHVPPRRYFGNFHQHGNRGSKFLD